MNIHGISLMTACNMFPNCLSSLATIDSHEDPDPGTDGAGKQPELLSTHHTWVQCETVASLPDLNMAW